MCMIANVHLFACEFEAPEWAGRLPVRVGEPAGGSLTADEYKLLIICPGAIVVRCGIELSDRNHFV